jgi:hypothetical protein
MSKYDPNCINIEQRSVYIHDFMSSVTVGDKFGYQMEDELKTYQNSQDSNIIESILIRIPLPGVWADFISGGNTCYLLSHHKLIGAINNFINDSYPLKELEYLIEHESKRYSELPRYLQRRILETKINLNLIKAGTPPDYKRSIIKRFLNFEST